MTAWLGNSGDPVRCRVFTKDVSVHWYEADAELCMCGATRQREDPTVCPGCEVLNAGHCNGDCREDVP